MEVKCILGKQPRKRRTRDVVEDGDDIVAVTGSTNAAGDATDFPGTARCAKQVRDVQGHSAAPTTRQQQQQHRQKPADAHRRAVVGNFS